MKLEVVPGNRDLKRFVADLIRGLEPQQKQIVTLRYYEKLEPAEIARTLDIQDSLVTRSLELFQAQLSRKESPLNQVEKPKRERVACTIPRVEKGVPIPVSGKGTSKWRDFILNLVAGDSFETEKRQTGGVTAAVKKYAPHYKCIVRTLDADRVRIWVVVK